MIRFDELVGDVQKLLTAHDDGTLSWPGADPSIYGRVNSAGDFGSAVQVLGGILYDNVYVHGRPAVTGNTGLPRAAGSGPGPHFVPMLQRANRSRFARQRGWVVVDHEGGQVVVERDGLRLWLGPDELEPDAGEMPSSPPAPGAAVTVLLYPDQLRMVPGFYTVLGEHEVTIGPEPRCRVYWNVTPLAAPTLVEALTGSLNRASVGFRLKVADRPDRFDRADALVLYLSPTSWEAVASGLAQVARDVGPFGDEVPAFTKRLTEGVAVAEDTGQGASFGEHRSRLLAAALLRAYQAGVEPGTAVVAFVRAYFADHGVDPDRPHVLGGRPDRYPVWEEN